MSYIAVIDYDAGNTMSVMNALKYLGYETVLSRNPEEMKKADRVIFPGVGAYADAMARIESYNLESVIKEVVAEGTPFLGICLGMQLLFDYSTENAADLGKDKIEGLGILPGNVTGFKEKPEFKGLKVPHMGWNSLQFCNPDSRLFKGIADGSFVYFVHSYYIKADKRDDVAATCNYGISFDASVEKGNIFGCQFHPEKSGDVGMNILKNFCELT